MALTQRSWADQDPQIVWQKYCGFLDLSMQQFKEIQEQLLMEQIKLVAASPLGRRQGRGSVTWSLQLDLN